MSNTPETDTRTYGFTDEDGIHCEAVHADFARDLERKLARANELLAEMKSALKWAKDEAKERLHRLDSAACERRTWLEAHREMKMQRDALKELSIQLAKELVCKCSDPVHRHQVSQLQDVADFFKYRPQTMCTSSP